MILKKIKIYHILKLFGYLIALPIVIIVRIISPILIIRWYCTKSTRIGHYCDDIHMSLAMKEQKINFLSKRKYIDIFYDRTSVCNKQLQKMWRRSGKIFFLPNWLMDPINNVCEYLIDPIITSKGLHYLGYYYDPKKLLSNKAVPLNNVDTFNSIDKTDKPVSFFDSEILEGNNILEKIGINKNDEYVVLALRGNDYLKNKYPNINWTRHSQRHSHRDTNIDYFHKTINVLTNKKLKVILIGSGVPENLSINNQNMINYENSEYKSEFMDIFLFSKNNCKFVISSISGIDSVGLLFHKPILEVGVIPFSYARTFSKYYNFIFKKYYSKTLDRYLTMKEIFELGLSQISGNELTDEIEFIHPNEEEILNSTIELLNKINNNFISDVKAKDLQEKFSKMYKIYIDKYDPVMTSENQNGKITESFILSNKYLLN